MVEQVGGEFGTGAGEEFTSADLGRLLNGTYAPVWMPIQELLNHEKVYPVDLAKLVLKAQTDGWPDEPIVIVERA